MATAGGAWRQAAANLLDVLKEMDIGQIFAKPVNQAIYRDYYEAFGKGYVRMLANATRKGEIRPGNNEVRVWALMGMSNFLGLRYALWEQDVSFDEIVETLSDLFRNGLTLDGKEKP